MALDLDTFVQHTIVAALWSEADDAGTPLDDDAYADKLSDSAMARIREDCTAWLAKHADLLAELEAAADEAGYGSHPDCGRTDPVAAAAGHDFWLTRNRHGVGFWDRGLGDLGQRLTDAAHAAGELNLYVGDDEMIYAH